MMSSTTLWKRLMLPSRFSLFQLAKVYRPLGNGSQPRVSLAPAEEPKGVDAALAAAVTSVGFLEHGQAQGLPGNRKHKTGCFCRLGSLVNKRQEPWRCPCGNES
eukprot:GHVT01070331.1.p1 GENE.GHVT01070331.1~~GHVT01070331.1.p1  ORF type:complete len:104 (+),score=13.73 GHVT01070331.1:108-419(+)